MSLSRCVQCGEVVLVEQKEACQAHRYIQGRHEWEKCVVYSFVRLFDRL